jgi:hypothetical protein
MRGHWFQIIVLNVHAPTEDKIDYVKDSFCEELERIFDKYPKYHFFTTFLKIQILGNPELYYD